MKCVAEQLLASLEGPFSVTLIVIHCNVLALIVFRLYTVLSIFMKVCTIPCHDRGHIYVVVLQSRTESLRILPTSSSETFPTSCDGTYDVGNMNVEEDVDVIEEIFTAVNKEADIGIKHEEIPENITFPDIKSEPDEVSYVCVYICLLLDTFYHCPEMTVFFRC